MTGIGRYTVDDSPVPSLFDLMSLGGVDELFHMGSFSIALLSPNVKSLNQVPTHHNDSLACPHFS